MYHLPLMKTQGFDYDYGSNIKFNRNPSIGSPDNCFYFVMLRNNFVSNSCSMTLKPSILYMRKDGRTDRYIFSPKWRQTYSSLYVYFRARCKNHSEITDSMWYDLLNLAWHKQSVYLMWCIPFQVVSKMYLLYTVNMSDRNNFEF